MGAFTFDRDDFKSAITNIHSFVCELTPNRVQQNVLIIEIKASIHYHYHYNRTA